MTYSDWVTQPLTSIVQGDFVRAAVVGKSLQTNMERTLRRMANHGGDHTVTSSTALVDLNVDSNKWVDMEANSLYYIYIHMTGRSPSAGGNPGIRVGFAGPTGCYISLQATGINSAGAFAVVHVKGTTITQETLWSIPATTDRHFLTFRGLVYVGLAAGTFKLRFAQATSNASGTTVNHTPTFGVKIGASVPLPTG